MTQFNYFCKACTDVESCSKSVSFLSSIVVYLSLAESRFLFQQNICINKEIKSSFLSQEHKE